MRDHRFTFLCTKEERAKLVRLALIYHRSQSDTVRMLIHNEALKILKDLNHNNPSAIGEEVNVQSTSES